jgi:hypothetical protein
MKYVLILAMAAMACSDAGSKNVETGSTDSKAEVSNPFPSIGGDTTITLAADEEYVNVMGNRKPALPGFTALTKKPGKVRGYAKNLNGQPIAGASIGIRSSAVGGYYSSASGTTDEKGYYEIELPTGACHFWNTSYALEYGGGMATVNLHPADGELASFASAEGAVENFVLLSYGIANRDKAFNQPADAFGYHGGSIRLEYDLYEDSWSRSGSLPVNSIIEITLTPEGETIYGETRTFTILKTIGGTNFTINNIPVGKYKITARLRNGGELKLKATDFWAHPVYGLRPKEATGKASILFTPYSTSSKSSITDRGSWKSTAIKLSK